MFLYNDIKSKYNTVEKRRAYVLKIANKLLDNPSVFTRYKNVLKNLLNNNKVIYVDHLYTTASVGKKYIKAEFLSVTATNFSYIKIGGKNIRYWLEQNKPYLIDYQLSHTILHEVHHIILRNNLHFKGMDDEIAQMGFGGGY